MTALATAIARGTNGARPAAGSPGRIYYDTTNSQLQRDNGSSWDSVEGAGGLADQGVVTYLDFTTAAAPSSPAAGKIRVYSKTGDHLAQKDSGGAETLLDATGGGAITLLSSNVLGSAAANITVTGISGSYKDLIVVIRCRSTDAAVGLGLSIRVGNGSIDSGSNYAYFVAYEGWTTGNASFAAAASAQVGICPNSGATAGFFGYVRLEILNYADSAKSRGIVGQGFTQDGSGILATRVGAAWRNVSAAMDQFQVFPSAGNLDTGSAVHIYGRG